MIDDTDDMMMIIVDTLIDDAFLPVVPVRISDVHAFTAIRADTCCILVHSRYHCYSVDLLPILIH